MLSEKQLKEIREHLEGSQRPIFFYDNDLDGLCSFILFARFLGRGKGVAVRTHPDIGANYARKVQELNADCVFVLDRPHLGKEFVEEIEKLQLPIVWIDHHGVVETYKGKNIYVFNPTKGKKKSNEPVTYWAYKVTKRKEDMWIAVMGCIADHYMPSFSKEFAKKYPELWTDKKIKDPFEALYNTDIGHYAKALSFGLKDSVTHVVYLQNFLVSCKNPGDVLLELESKSSFAKKYGEIKRKYDALIDKAKKSVEGRIVFFNYSGNLSISSEVSNELSFLYPNHYVVVSYSAGPISNISIRGENVKDILLKILPKFKDASGGGHQGAVGSRIQSSDLERFKKEFEDEVSKKHDGKK